MVLTLSAIGQLASSAPADQGESKQPAARTSPAAQSSSWWPGPLAQRFDADTEVTWTSDILLTETALAYQADFAKVRWDVSFAHNLYYENYRPFHIADPFGFAEILRENRYAGQLTARPRLTDRLTLILSGGAYDGFQDYRRVWLNNYYRQQFANPRFPPIPGYEPADPKGWNAGAGLRWEYLARRGFLEARGGYNVDDVAPGFVHDPATGFAVGGQARLYTTWGSLSSENILSPRVRALNELRISDTTTRQARVSWQSSLNAALGERWVLRPYGGYTREAPKFEAWWIGQAVEFEATPVCALILSGHYYHDTGEILDPLVLSSAAPALGSWQASLGLRINWGRATVRISVGPYFTDYQKVAQSSLAFANLYRDRQWGLAQIAIGVPF
jgi:hypothetical protein